MLAYAASSTSLQGVFRKLQPVVKLALLEKTDMVGYRGWVEPEYQSDLEEYPVPGRARGSTRARFTSSAIRITTCWRGVRRLFRSMDGRFTCCRGNGSAKLNSWQIPVRLYIFAGPQIGQLIFNSSPKLQALGLLRTMSL